MFNIDALAHIVGTRTVQGIVMIRYRLAQNGSDEYLRAYVRDINLAEQIAADLRTEGWSAGVISLQDGTGRIGVWADLPALGLCNWQVL